MVNGNSNVCSTLAVANIYGASPYVSTLADFAQQQETPPPLNIRTLVWPQHQETVSPLNAHTSGLSYGRREQ